MYLLKQRSKSHGKMLSPIPKFKLRVSEGIALKKLKIIDSINCSIWDRSASSSNRGMVEGNYCSSQIQSNHPCKINSQQASSLLQTQRLVATPTVTERPSFTTEKINQNRKAQLQLLFTKHHGADFIQSLIQYINTDWKKRQEDLLTNKQLESLLNSISSRTNSLNQLIQDFLCLQYENYSSNQAKLLASILFKQQMQTVYDFQSKIIQLLKKFPQEKLVKQEIELENLFEKLLLIYDPACTSSSINFKDRLQLYQHEYTVNKNYLQAELCFKLKTNFQFLEQTEKYLSFYQKEVMKIKKHLSAVEAQKRNSERLLAKKINFAPVEINYQKVQQLKEELGKNIIGDLQSNYVKYHQNIHSKNALLIRDLEAQINQSKLQLRLKEAQTNQLRQQIQNYQSRFPRKKDCETQVFLLPSLKAKDVFTNQTLNIFIQNVFTPFSFKGNITSNFVSLIVIDKVFHDYNAVQNCLPFNSFREFMFEWFIKRIGCKSLAQIFIKNFTYSIKELQNKHKRYSIFSKIMGIKGFRMKSMQEDLEYIFFQTQLAWYHLLKLALLYRSKLSAKPAGYHLLPPIQCQQIFKIPLRKAYQVVEDHLASEEIQVPSDIHQRLDCYAINQISKYKGQTQTFQKEQLQQIHILRELNFDIIAGFVLEYISHSKCTILQKFFQALHLRQTESNSVLNFSDFEIIYKKFYRSKKQKVEAAYIKLCLSNQHDLKNVQNMIEFIKIILEDEVLVRKGYEKIQSLRSLVPRGKVTFTKNNDSKLTSVQQFRENYYHQFYDFYNTTACLEEIFKLIKKLIQNKLRKLKLQDRQIQELTQVKSIHQAQIQSDSSSNSCAQSSFDSAQVSEDSKTSSIKTNKNISNLQLKIKQWSQIMARVPHFTRNVLTIDQITIHNMRRKQMIEGSEFAWKTLKDIFGLLEQKDFLIPKN